jgi:hypothetical protein
MVDEGNVTGSFIGNDSGYYVIFSDPDVVLEMR